MINMGGPKYWSIVQQCTLQPSLKFCQECTIDTTCPNTPCCRKRFWNHPKAQTQKRSTPSVSLKRKVRGNAAGSSGFGEQLHMLGPSSHVVENLWPGTTETESPQEFLLARVSTIVMDILTCFTVAIILIVKRHFVRHQLVSPSAVWVEFVLLCLHSERTSHFQVFQICPGLCHSAFLWRLACDISQQVHSIFSCPNHAW